MAKRKSIQDGYIRIPVPAIHGPMTPPKPSSTDPSEAEFVVVVPEALLEQVEKALEDGCGCVGAAPDDLTPPPACSCCVARSALQRERGR